MSEKSQGTSKDPAYKTTAKVISAKNLTELESGLQAAVNDGFYAGSNHITIIPEHHAFGSGITLAVLAFKTVQTEVPENAKPSTPTPVPIEATPVTIAPENGPQVSAAPTPAADPSAPKEVPQS